MSGIKITKAVYGTGSTTVDVKTSVMSNIKDGNLSLVVTPDALNITDPAPGQQKTLNVTYTINNGKQMTESVNDNETLMISAPPERRATGLQITKAEYGYPGNFTDVTDSIQNHVRNGGIKITVGPKSAGIPDPNPNQQKSLLVEYTLNGSPNSVELVDGKVLYISAPPLDSVDPRTPTDYVGDLIAILFRNTLLFVGMFLYTISIFTTAAFFDTTPIFKADPQTVKDTVTQIKEGVMTAEGGKRILFLAIGAVLPGVAYWGLPFYVFGRRLFSNSYVI